MNDTVTTRNVVAGLAPAIVPPVISPMAREMTSEMAGASPATTLHIPKPRALVLRAPGINCDRETAHACRLAGFETDLVHINRLLQDPERLLDYHLLVIPGGFSYGDDLGAGTLLAMNLTIHLGGQMRRFIDEGRLVLGICNGFQALVRAGLLPGRGRDDEHSQSPSVSCHSERSEESVAPTVEILRFTQNDMTWSRPDGNTTQTKASLTNNASAQFECRWISLRVQDSPCIFTRGIDSIIELPVAHGEGQFVLADVAQLAGLQACKQIPIVYTSNAWQASLMSPSPATLPFTGYENTPYPANPNGSIGDIAGICNARGNVFGLMPHPERYVDALQHPQRRGNTKGEGDGLQIFKNAYAYACELAAALPRGTRPHPPDTHKGYPYMSNYPTPQWGGSGSKPGERDAYAASGVDISAAERAKAMMREAVQASQGPEVLAGMGAFAGVFDLGSIKDMRGPALVASTDGVGTKTLLAAQAGRYDTIGYDLVNHSVNDLLTQGARPLFFMDYLAMGRLEAEPAAAIVRSVANACRKVGCALLGGETAEMPDVYLPGAFDLAGTIVGVVERDALAGREAMRPGDVLLGLPSSGLHTNGYSLARRIFAPYAPETVFPELGEPLIDALLRPHRVYLDELQRLQEHLGLSGIKGIAHITGGGFEGNISRILPPGAQAVVETTAWDVPPLFRLIQRLGNIDREEMYRAFNMGVGMALVVSPEAAEEARRILPELLTIGYIKEGNGVVII
jgi:phosphoribosylformylglycinamidine synthase I